ncbi:ArsR family transcriptional regulator [Oceanobacter sp. 4_MG-2023]|uniref:VpaChn25_0724 family phage protein n=1 Tax=Oceanobacter sp. 4_MG-2023 TaxID=3062623 RepID=UPI00273651D0|nr:ArsR family transcriptional regulator [Oceanobacter sp. 4_MG-2023]MDP2548072.1 ArsR family transcriptional regulator [Oceanobacter sp. 4_MG-2023]
MAYQDLLNQDQRLVILRSLTDVNGTANDSIINKMLDAYGHRLSRDQVKTHLYWLSEQGLIDIESVLSTDVATITSRGVDVAQGRARVPGIGQPRPGV